MITKFDPEQECYAIYFNMIIEVKIESVVISSKRKVYFMYDKISPIIESNVFETKELAELELKRRMGIEKRN
jgi:hypothetical protein